MTRANAIASLLAARHAVDAVSQMYDVDYKHVEAARSAIEAIVGRLSAAEYDREHTATSDLYVANGADRMEAQAGLGREMYEMQKQARGGQ